MSIACIRCALSQDARTSSCGFLLYIGCIKPGSDANLIQKLARFYLCIWMCRCMSALAASVDSQCTRTTSWLSCTSLPPLTVHTLNTHFTADYSSACDGHGFLHKHSLTNWHFKAEVQDDRYSPSTQYELMVTLLAFLWGMNTLNTPFIADYSSTHDGMRSLSSCTWRLPGNASMLVKLWNSEQTLMQLSAW